MTTFELHGTTFKTLEHIAEVKQRTALFNRFYNKKQLFKAYLNKFIFNEDGVSREQSYKEVLETSNGFTPCGRYVHVGKTDWYVMIVKIEDIPESKIEDLKSKMIFSDSFFLKDDNGQIFYFEIDED